MVTVFSMWLACIYVEKHADELANYKLCVWHCQEW
jgi:hypothetical protein